MNYIEQSRGRIDGPGNRSVSSPHGSAPTMHLLTVRVIGTEFGDTEFDATDYDATDHNAITLQLVPFTMGYSY